MRITSVTFITFVVEWKTGKEKDRLPIDGK